MSTKDHYSLPFKDKQSTVINDAANRQYINLNLNQKFQNTSNAFPESPKSISTEKIKHLGYDFTYNNSKRDFHLWKKETKDLPPYLENNDGLKKGKNHLNTSNRSSLSLHISTYERMIKVSSDLINDTTEENSKKIRKDKNATQIFANSVSVFQMQNSFEFPRQQENDQSKAPEIAQFKTSQRLLNSNQMRQKAGGEESTSKKKKSSNNNNEEQNKTSEETPKKSGWRRLFTRFRRKQKPSTEESTPIQVTQSAADLPKESQGSGLSCVRKKIKKNGNDDETPVEANASWKGARKTKSMEVSSNAKSSKKVRSSSKRQRRKKNEIKRPSKETIVEPTLDVTQTPEQTQEPPLIDASTKNPSLPPQKPQQKEDEIDESRKISRKKSPSKEGDDLSLSKSVQRSFRSFRNNRAKDFKTVKTFISRTYQKQAIEKVVAEVEARKQRRNESNSDSSTSSTSTTKLHHGDDIFPQRKPHQQCKHSSNDKNNNNKSLTRIFGKHEKSVDQSCSTLIETNKSNGGELFLSNGRPFWQQVGKGKPNEPDDDELTDDELPLNAEAVLDVHRGKIKLTDMPSTTITLDPYGPATALIEHDKKFFTRDLIFSNTVRSMINLDDELADRLSENRATSTTTTEALANGITKRCQFVMPQHISRYSKSQPDEFKEEKFTPKNVERK
uniref:Uncharacterized protein n=1 Tax=Panagrolaimus sp. PS1159 TaxID=55785 RepID=A0AC35FDN5_9BILA